jgi:hypothetical protein
MKKTAHQIADHVLAKTAAITRDEIASGLAGRKQREISDEEIENLVQEYGDRAYQEHKNAPLWGGGTGGVVGGGLGALMGAGGARYGRGGRGALIGGLTGLGIGGGIGALIGHGVRSGATSHARDLGSTVGGVAQTGHIPYEFPGDVGTDDLIPYARGIQGEPAPIDPQAERDTRERLMNRLMLVRGTEGAIRGGLSGALASRDREDASGDAILNAAIHGGIGTLRGRSEAREIARQVLSLQSRGYNTLADRYYNDSLDPSILGY